MAESLFRAEILDAIEKYEPRVEVENVTFESVRSSELDSFVITHLPVPYAFGPIIMLIPRVEVNIVDGNE